MTLSTERRGISLPPLAPAVPNDDRAVLEVLRDCLRRLQSAPDSSAALGAIAPLRDDLGLLRACTAIVSRLHARLETRCLIAQRDGSFLVGAQDSPAPWRPPPRQLEAAAVLAHLVAHPGGALDVSDGLGRTGQHAAAVARRALRRAAESIPDARLAGALVTGLVVRDAGGRALASWSPPADAPRIVTSRDA